MNRSQRDIRSCESRSERSYRTGSGSDRVKNSTWNCAKQNLLPSGFETLIEKLKKEIEQSGIEDGDIRNDLKSAVSRWGPRNAQQTFRALLTRYGLIDQSLEGIPEKRVRGVWKMRHRIAHEGDFAFPDWIDADERRRDVAIFIAARLIPAMVMVYLNRKFGLMEFERVQRNSGIIKEYIYKGTHEGDVVDGL